MRMRTTLVMLVGSGMGTYFLCKGLGRRKEGSLSSSDPSSSEPALPKPPAPPVPVRRVHHPLAGDSLPFVPGMRYFAAVNVGFPASLGANAGKIKALAERQGFADVVVAEKRKPAWWPGTHAEADYFIMGDYRGQPQSLSRKPGPGVEVLEAFVY